MTNSFLSKQCKEVILGSLLGDGSLKIHHQYKNARFSFRHSIKQKEYFFWKLKQLKEISGEKCWWIQSNNELGGDKLRYQSLALKSLTDLYQLTHKRQRLRIRRKWLNMLTPLSLAVWWLDDGSLITNGRRGVLCTDSFSYEEQKLIARYLYKIWGVKVAIGKIHREWNGKLAEYYRLWIRSSKELQKLLRIILPYIKIVSMLPKVLLMYKNINLQQRWISEVSKTTGFSQTVIEKYLNEKKSRWKKFRE
ncbi:MAG TPA: hypothetical protein ENH26_01015 [Candidatus Wolfebacteria bacterium]|nr:hypothetical protein [Candidatus Wolfebacteria bacterium]